jgi:hypothetical protein
MVSALVGVGVVLTAQPLQLFDGFEAISGKGEGVAVYGEHALLFGPDCEPVAALLCALAPYQLAEVRPDVSHMKVADLLCYLRSNAQDALIGDVLIGHRSPAADGA